MTDNIDHPAHYTGRDIDYECIDITQHQTFLVGNVIKYLWRYRLKNGTEDLRKAAVYLDWMIEAEEKAAAECTT